MELTIKNKTSHTTKWLSSRRTLHWLQVARQMHGALRSDGAIVFKLPVVLSLVSQCPSYGTSPKPTLSAEAAVIGTMRASDG